MFLPVVLPSGRPPSLSVTWEVHCRSNPSSVPLLYLGKSGLERKLLVFANAVKGGLSSPILFPYQPSVIGIVLYLAHPTPSHCYSVHPESSTHHPTYISARALHQLYQIALQRSNGIGQEGTISTSSMSVHH